MMKSFRLRGFAPGATNRGATIRGTLLRLEPLESRALLSAISLVDSALAQPAIDFSRPAATPSGFNPSQIRHAYGFDQIFFANGTVQGDGSGQTIAIVDAFDDPNIANDLHTFDTTFGLPDPPQFTKLNQTGGTTLPKSNISWGQEISLDVEWAHGIAPKANILLVEANSSKQSDLLAGVDFARARAGVSVVSMSWGGSETSNETTLDQHFVTPAGHTGVTFFASAGDGGAQALWPAVSPNVVGVGGTTLALSSGNYGSESAWSGSGGGTSKTEPEPAYQTQVQSSGFRTGPDVAYDSNPSSGFAVYDSFGRGRNIGWLQVGGTSAAAPQWAALFAIANQGRVILGQGTIAAGPGVLYTLPNADFHDITTGSNGNSAHVGYDLVTGLGTPIANAVVGSLVGSSASTVSASARTTSASLVSVTHRHDLVFRQDQFWLLDLASNSLSNTTESDSANSALAQIEFALTEANPAAPMMSVQSSAVPLASPAAPQTGSSATVMSPMLIGSTSSGGSEKAHREATGLDEVPSASDDSFAGSV